MRSFKSESKGNQSKEGTLSQEEVSHLVGARQTAAEVLALAAVELFPDTLLFQGEGTYKTFFYDFHFPFPFQAEFLPLLEEKMRQIVRKDLDINVLEMVPGN